MHKSIAALGAALLLTVFWPTSPASAASSQRLVMYYQTQYDGSRYVSPLGLTQNDTGLTDLILGAVHLNDDQTVHLNDDPPDDPKFTQMWDDVHTMQSQGVHALAFVGGAAAGSFQHLDNDFDTYYPLLRDFLSTYHLDGVDLDVEEQMSLSGMERLIDQLHADFGDGFIVTMAPVATELSGGGGLSGLDYDTLYQDRGSEIAWFNAQLYCGWGSLGDTAGYQAIIDHGVVPASKVVAGTLTNPANCASGYVDMDQLTSTIGQLKSAYPDFGGVDGWEYFNSLPGGTDAPWQWSQQVGDALGL
jgi:chitinase